MIDEAREFKVLVEELFSRIEDGREMITDGYCSYQRAFEAAEKQVARIRKEFPAIKSAYRDAEGWVLFDESGEPVNWPASWPNEVDTDFLREHRVTIREG